MTVGYTRLSLDKYGDQLGVTRQREDIIALAKGLGWPDVTEFYEDNDVSANVDRRRPRPEFDRLLADIRASRVTHVLCYDQDRLLRDMRQLEDVVEAVEAGNVKLTSVNGDIDLLTDNGRMVARIKAAVARHEIEKLSRRIKRQKLQKAQSGVKNQGCYRTFGFRRDFNPMPREAAILKEVFERKARGDSAGSIAKWLNESRVRTTTRRIGRWNANRVTELIRRREYAGDVTINGQVVAKGRFEPLIDREIFEEANRRTPKRVEAWRKAEDLGLLTGLMLCGVCGAKMKRGHGQHNGTKYLCRRYQPKRQIRHELVLSVAVDSAVLEAVWAKAQKLRRASGPQPWLSAHAAALELEIERAKQMRDRHELAGTKLEIVLQHLRDRLADESWQPPPTPHHAGAAPDGWDEWDLESRRRWLARFVSHIVVSRPIRTWPGPRVEAGRIALHFSDGQVQHLAGPGELQPLWPAGALPRDWITRTQAAELTGLTVTQIDWWRRQGRIRHRSGKDHRASLHRTSVEEFGQWHRDRYPDWTKPGKPPTGTGWLSTTQAAAVIGVSRKRVAQLAESLNAVRQGGRYWIPEAEAIAFAKRRAERRGREAAEDVGWIGLEEAAQIIGCSQSTVLGYANLGVIEQRNVIPRNRPSLRRDSVVLVAERWAAFELQSSRSRSKRRQFIRTGIL